MSKGISIHIGMEYFDSDYYNGASGSLPKCGKDCLDMQEIAEAQNFESVKLLRNEDATRGAVAKAISDASNELVSGDMLFLSYSGHGSSIPDANGDEEDEKDESWCLYDGFFLDDELYALWTKFEEGVRIFIVSDSCHSGTISKVSPMLNSDNVIVSKYFPEMEAKNIYEENKAFYDEVKKEAVKSKDKEVKATVKLISGCQDKESSYVLSNSDNSLLTDSLNQVWQGGQFVGSTVEFFEAIKEIVTSIAKERSIVQTPNLFTIGKENTSFDEQKPFAIYVALDK